MGAVKSIRFNKKTESMFGVVRAYLSKHNNSVTDSEIIANGIQMQYDEIAEDINHYFRKKMLEEIRKEESADIFNQSANMLEILSLSSGSTLESEFWCFLLVNVECGSVYDTDDGEKVCQTKQYLKIYETLEKTFEEDVLENALSEINTVYRKLLGKK